MAEEEAKGTEEATTEKEQDKKKGGKSKKMLFIIIGAVVLIAGGAGAVFGLGLFSDNAAANTATETAVNAVETETSIEEVGKIVGIKPFVVNLADDDEDRYLKVTVELELKDDKVAADCEVKMARIKDVMISLFSSKTFHQVRDIKGKIKLRQEIVVRTNEILGKGSVRHVYFTEFIVQ